jgi:hypothetical protein
MTLTQIGLIIHLLAISLALGLVFSNIVGFRIAKGLGGDKALGIAAHRESLIPYSDIFFGTIVASGLFLLWAIGGSKGLPVWFHIKMAAVLVWAIGYIVMRLRIAKFLATREITLVPMIKSLMHAVLGAAVLALIFAVLTFAG